MLYREIIAVCSQIHTKHINTLCGQNNRIVHVKLAVYEDSIRTAQWTHSFSVIKTSQLMLYREIIAFYSQINTKHKYTVWAESRIAEC
jgi:hypothetical protein